MATTSRPPADVSPAGVAPQRSDRSPWNWLLLIPIVVALLVVALTRGRLSYQHRSAAAESGVESGRGRVES